MKTGKLFINVFILLSGAALCFAQGSAFTYHGQLKDGGLPATGAYDLRFGVWNAETNGSLATSPMQWAAVPVTNGQFAVLLDFGPAAFNGEPRWLEVGVRPAASTNNFALLSPRQLITSMPYAIRSISASGLATPANQPLEFYTGGQCVLRLETGSNSAGCALNFIAGSGSNGVAAGVIGATIAGGGPSPWATNARPQFIANSFSTIGGGIGNCITGEVSTICGGYQNAIEYECEYSFIGGGYENVMAAGADFAVLTGGEANYVAADWAVVGGGKQNAVQDDARFSLIGGGFANIIEPKTYYSTLAGGANNTIGASSYFAAIGGGYQNKIAPANSYSTIGGGATNAVGGAANFSVIGGGAGNIIQTGVKFATIPGGSQNTAAGQSSLAAGNHAQALHDGAFVWGDSTAADMASAARDSWTVRASGGTRFFSDAAATVGVQLAAGGNAWSPMSDRHVKENFKPVDPRAVLDKVSRLPVTEWNLVSQPVSIRHLGPMAQDFQAAFGLGEDDKHISTSDADGVALAAIQGLNQKLDEALKAKDARIQKLEQDLADLKALLEQSVPSRSGGKR